MGISANATQMQPNCNSTPQAPTRDIQQLHVKHHRRVGGHAGAPRRRLEGLWKREVPGYVDAPDPPDAHRAERLVEARHDLAGADAAGGLLLTDGRMGRGSLHVSN